MVFSSSIFLFAFLPLVLLMVFIGPRLGERGVVWRNFSLTCASFVFYAWGEPKWVVPLFALAGINYILSKHIEKHTRNAKNILIAGVSLNLSLLLFVKYGAWFGNYILDFLQFMGVTQPFFTRFTPMALPLGISFFTFQAISYLIDIYRGNVHATKTYINFSCYLTMFSQLVAGPIVRYKDIADAIVTRRDSLDMFYAGVQRFILGLGKKILIANNVALLADWAFQMDTNELTMYMAWIGILAYAAQIYFDFSAYSDMAIGLGLMFGFRFLENFRHPYAALSIQDFWRRWHISLSSWFRDYLYIPLGGNKISAIRTYLNLTIVFFLCGLWHGASVNFILWGLWHGAFLIMEKAGLYKRLSTLPRWFCRVYVWLVFLGGWVLFRAEDMAQATTYYVAMLGMGDAGIGSLLSIVRLHLWGLCVLLVALFASGGGPVRIFMCWRECALSKGPWFSTFFEIVTALFGMCVLLLCTSFILAGSYNPFIYFRF